jgi:ubiquinone/menaquinone biosynthesis C-methylase UbiE
VITDGSDLGQRGVSEALRSFVRDKPHERTSILAFVREVAGALTPGEVVLDIGAGQAPYRELFEHCRYLTSDWEQSLHERAAEAGMVAPADSLALADGSVDAVLMTQVLEHLPEPAAALREAARVLRRGGGIFLTVPFAWELHELPYDFWRFTPGSLEHLLTGAGFVEIAVEPRTDCFATMAQLLRNLGTAMGRAPDGRDQAREEAAALLAQLAELLPGLAELDVDRVLPLGWSATARRA